MEFKNPLTVEEQTKYLHDTKRVIYNEISESEAQKILYEHNYINVISPFKYRFARKNKKEAVIKDQNNCHIYERDVDFKEYFNLYTAERNKYPLIFKNIMKFEQLISSIVSYETLIFYNIHDDFSYSNFIFKLRGNINSSQYKENTKQHMLKIKEELEKGITAYKSPYIVLDNLSLNSILTILVNLDTEAKRKCIQEIINRQNIIKSFDEKTFYNQASKIIRIRNCICHNDSLEILLRYLSRKYKTLRTSSDKHSYAKLIQKLLVDNEK